VERGAFSRTDYGSGQRYESVVDTRTFLGRIVAGRRSTPARLFSPLRKHPVVERFVLVDSSTGAVSLVGVNGKLG